VRPFGSVSLACGAHSSLLGVAELGLLPAQLQLELLELSAELLELCAELRVMLARRLGGAACFG
jgi:hypothetical protein